jgi:signal transduction histidine kinase
LNLQARLTFWSIVVMALIVTTISALDLIDEVNRQFEITVHRSESIWRLASSAVNRSLLRKPSFTPAQSVEGDPELTRELREVLREGGPVVAIAVCDQSGKILNDADTSRITQPFPTLQNFRDLVSRTHWWEKVQVLRQDKGIYDFGADLVSIRAPSLTLQLIVDPVMVRQELSPAMRTHFVISVASIIGSIFLTLIFSVLAFRPLGHLGHMLDGLAEGKFELHQVQQKKSAPDQFGIVESKVSLLGEALRDAQSEASDLRGNFERLLDELEDAVFIFGRDRRLIAAAGAVEHFLLKPRGSLIGQPLAEVFPPGTSLGLLLAQAIQNTRGIRNRRVPMNHSDGSDKIMLALLSVEFLDSSAAGMCIRLRDPEATKMIGRQLQTADRLTAISKLTGGVAHEVKNPLNAMLMHVELAKMKLNNGDYDLHPQMEVISSEILRLDRVVKTFLDFTRPVSLNLIEAPLTSFVDEIAELARPQAEAANIVLTVRQSSQAATVTVDSDLLKQALLNIVVNAIEAMPEGGTLTIESGVHGDSARISIADSGSGIPPALRDNIYNLYFTTKAKGSGIGLAMTFRIIQLHDGRIDFVSEPGKGTVFTVELPLAMEVAE